MEIVQYVQHGGGAVTPKYAEAFRQSLPALKIKNVEIDPKEFPHLHGQIEFLIDLFEDFADGVYRDLPYVAFAETVFALQYVHRVFDLIPDHLPGIGFADDSSVIRAVLIRHERVLADFARSKSLKWRDITAQP